MSPGFFRPARMFSMTNGRPVTSDIASEERRTWPPPSPAEPSIASTASAILWGFVGYALA